MYISYYLLLMVVRTACSAMIKYIPVLTRGIAAQLCINKGVAKARQVLKYGELSGDVTHHSSSIWGL